MAIQDEIMAIFQNPAILASLQNTMGPAGGIQSQADAAVAQQQADLAAHTQAATQAATAAGTQYQQAAAAPVSQVDPLQTFMQTLSGGVSSALTGDKGFTQRAAANLDEIHADLIRSRLDNLMALKDTYDKRAHAADVAGATEEALKSRLASDKANKAAQDILDKQRSQSASGLQTQRDDAALKRLQLSISSKPAPVIKPGPKVKAGFDEAGNYSLKGMDRVTMNGRKWVDLGDLTGDARNAAIAAAHDQGFSVPDKASASGLVDVNRAQRDIKKLLDFAQPIVPLDPQGRATGWARRKISEMAQSDPRRAAFRVWADAAIPILRATAGSKNLRITQQQVQLAIKNLPTQQDTWETVLTKAKVLNTLLDNAEASLLEANGASDGTGQAPASNDPEAKYRRK